MDVRKRNTLRVLKWVCYVLTFILAVIMQTTPGFLTMGEVKPIFVLPLCLAIAVCEGEFAGAVFGAFGGLIWDMLAGRVIGFFAFGVMMCCFGASILAQLYLKENNTNFILITGIACFIITGADFLFGYLMQGYANASEYYLSVTLPIIIFSSVLAPLSLILCKKIKNKFEVEN